MIFSPLRIVTKTACVVPTDVPDRFVVLVYVDGKLDSAHPPTNLRDADLLVDKVIDMCGRFTDSAVAESHAQHP